MSTLSDVSGSFVREQLRAPLTLVLLVAIPAFFVLIFAGVLGEFSKALGGTLAARSATSISAGWAAAFLAGTLGFFQVSSSRGDDDDEGHARAGDGQVHGCLRRRARRRLRHAIRASGRPPLGRRGLPRRRARVT